MWQCVRGHEALVQSFDRVVRRGRLAHAYLFCGLPGVGKRLFAGELAKALLCEAPPGERLEACDHCSACVQVAAGTHPDLFLAGRPEENLELPIRVMRELCQRLALKPARGQRKVAIVDDADDLNEEAANCFLKTLEEPPPGSVLILIGTSADQQLPTIISRCQVVHFAPLTAEDVKAILRTHGLEESALVERITRLSGGSPGLAMALADPALWDFRRALLEALLQTKPDALTVMQVWTHFVEEAGKESAAQRRRASLTLRLLVQFLQTTLATRLGTRPQVLEPDDQGFLETLATRVSVDQLLALIERCLAAASQVERRVQLVLVLEGLVDDLIQVLR